MCVCAVRARARARVCVCVCVCVCCFHDVCGRSAEAFVNQRLAIEFNQLNAVTSSSLCRAKGWQFSSTRSPKPLTDISSRLYLKVFLIDIDCMRYIALDNEKKAFFCSRHLGSKVNTAPAKPIENPVSRWHTTLTVSVFRILFD